MSIFIICIYTIIMGLQWKLVYRLKTCSMMKKMIDFEFSWKINSNEIKVVSSSFLIFQDRRDIIEILLKVALNTIKPNQTWHYTNILTEMSQTLGVMRFRKVSGLYFFFLGGPEENHRPVGSHWQTLSHTL
jgi:hypothetical protein